MSANRSNRPLGWLVFGAGGFLVAFMLPIQVFLYGIAIPLGLIRDPGYQGTLELLQHPLTKLYLFILVSLAFFHAAYRIKDTIADTLWMRQLDTVLAYLCYGGALAGTIAAIVVLWNAP
jgi:fumarate reductase subunit D